MKYLINNLELVYPPISNQEAEWLSKDKDVRKIVESSKLYMIGQREEIFFDEIEFHPILKGLISFRLKMGKLSSPKIFYSIYNKFSQFTNEDDEIQLEFGPKLIRATLNDSENVIQWFTPDIFLYLLSKNKIKVKIHGNFDFTQFSKYELHYVGISKQDDSFSRLFDQGHKGRLKILSNEYTKKLESRLTDELLIFFFNIEPININIIGQVEEVDEDFNYYSDKIKVISDAEKAFVKLLNTKYNEVKFIQYPISVDGLYNEGIRRYGFSILEDITFYTASVEFKGNKDFSGKADLILVEGNDIELIKAI